MSLTPHSLVSLVSAGGDGGGFEKPGTAEFWQPLIPWRGDGAWALTRPSVVVIISVAVIAWWFSVATSKKLTLVPSKRQWLVEQSYDFVRNTIGRDVIGAKEFMKYVPLLLTLFTFILLNNVSGIIPIIQFPSTSRIAFPLVATVVVYVVYNVAAIKHKHGIIGYLKSLVPSGLDMPLPAKVGLSLLMFIIEFATYFIIRPLTLALRLFGNMLAGHLLLLVFFLGAEYLLFHADGIGMKAAGVASAGMGIAMTFFELLVEFLQAFIFTMLAAVYIADAVSDHH